MALENSNQKTLSICIPTWNRKNYLEELLNNLNYVFDKFEDNIELIIADNKSNDGTEEILKYYSVNTRIQTIVINQKTHVSVQANLLTCFLKTTGKYVLFLGDDDRLIKWNFLKLLDYLTDIENEVDIVVQPIQARLDAPFDVNFFNVNDAEQYFKYFYDYGNAYSGIIRREVLQYGLIDEYVMRQSLGSVWPQTILAYSSLIIFSKKRNVTMLILNCRIGHGPYDGFTYISSTYRTTRSFIDLYLASLVVELVAKRDNTALKKILSKKYLCNRLIEICYLSCDTKTLTLDQKKEIFSRFEEFRNVSFVRKSLWFVSISKLRFFIYVIFKIYKFILIIVYKFRILIKFIPSFFLHKDIKVEPPKLASGVKEDSGVF